MEKYSVVHFLEENSVEAVPNAWISPDKKYCRWPNAKDKKSIKGLKKKSCVPAEDWPFYEIRILGSYADYDTARTKCKIAETTSDLEGGRGKTSGPGTLNQIPVNVTPPSAPAYGASYVDQVDPGTQQPAEPDAIPITFIEDHTAIHELSATCTEFHKISLENQELMKAELKEVKQLLLRSLAQTTGQPAPHTFPLLPVCDNTELYALEDWLATSDNYGSLVQSLSRIGGSGPPKIVYNILTHVFSHDLSKSLRLTKKSGKTAVRDLIITKAIIEASLKTRGFDLTEKQVTSHIGIWFRSVEDRKGGRSTRKNKKNSAVTIETQNGGVSPNQDAQDQESSSAIVRQDQGA